MEGWKKRRGQGFGKAKGSRIQGFEDSSGERQRVGRLEKAKGSRSRGFKDSSGLLGIFFKT